MRKKRTYRFIDHLNELVACYNASPHRSLNYIAPKEVNTDNEADLWAHMYLKKPKIKSKPKTTTTSYKPPIRCKKGQLVRVSLHKRPFLKSYYDQFSTEVFKVASVKLVQGIPMYKLQDLKQNTIQGQFYNSELLAVNKDADSLKEAKTWRKTAIFCKMGRISKTI